VVPGRVNSPFSFFSIPRARGENSYLVECGEEEIWDLLENHVGSGRDAGRGEEISCGNQIERRMGVLRENII